MEEKKKISRSDFIKELEACYLWKREDGKTFSISQEKVFIDLAMLHGAEMVIENWMIFQEHFKGQHPHAFVEWFEAVKPYENDDMNALPERNHEFDKMPWKRKAEIYNNIDIH